MAGMVTVACKVPNGIFIQGIPVHGYAYDKSEPPPQNIVGGYALTSGVDADAWAKWLHENADSDLVRKELIFADADERQVRAKARSKGGLRQLQTKVG